jgi:uncharacterized membrane protein
MYHERYRSQKETDMNKRTKRASTITTSARGDWQIPAALIALTVVPVAAGVARLVGLVGGAEITPENARFFAAPLPVVVHILSVTLFCILGAFQFSPGFRRHRPGWHRVAGRLVVASGSAAGLSGLWMTQFYPLHDQQLQGDLLYVFRLLVGSAMVVCIALGWAAVMRRDIARHRAWMIRGYAIGQGAGTQVLVLLPWTLIFGIPSELNRDVLMIAAWVINIAVAEWIIRRRPRRGRVDHAQGVTTFVEGNSF